MTRVEWAPGDRSAVVLDGVALLVAADVPGEQVIAVWDRLAASEITGLGTLLEVLGEVTRAPLSSLPDFAMAVLDDKGLHVAARGGSTVRVVHTDGAEVDLDGSEVSTWLERNVDAASTAHVCLGSTADGGGWLPLVGGVVPAGAVRLLVADHVLPAEPPAEPRTAPRAVAPASVPSSAETLADPDPDPAPEIDSAPDFQREPEPEPAPEPEPEPAARSGHLAHMYTPHTVLQDIEEAAVRAAEDDELVGDRQDPPALVADPVAPSPAAEAPVAREPVPEPQPPAAPATFISGVPSAAPAPPVQVVGPGDDRGGEHHDGHTLLEAPDSTEIDAYLASGGASPESDGTVLGVWCPGGHANPTHRTECRVCGQRLVGEGVRMPRPGLGWLVTSAGEQIELVQDVLAGRNPQASRIQGTVLPRLLPLPHSHVSGTHLEIRLEGWSVMVADLDSTNGTFLQRPGQPTVRISRSPQLLTSDDVVQLGHGVDLRFEALP